MDSVMQHNAGDPIECLSIAIELTKEDGKCGFKIGGGMDQDPSQAPFKYPDSGVYITHVVQGGPAERAGLKLHDKILQVNGNDFTMITHDKAVHYVKKYTVLQILVARTGMPSTPE